MTDLDASPLLTPDEDPSTVMGSIEPRLYTEPLVTEWNDSTTYGFRFITWCEERAYPLDEWEEWIAVRVGELLPDGRPRFRRVLIIVARQNGKTLLIKLLILWWAYEDGQRMILMTSLSLEYARIAWSSAAEMTGVDVPMPVGERPLLGIEPARVRFSNGQERMVAVRERKWITDEKGRKVEHITPGGTFAIAASKGDSGGRSMALDRLVIDELRHHTNWEAYNAGVLAMNAVKTSQAVFITNQGDVRAVVLRALRKTALGGGDRRLGIFEYSAPPGSRPDDPRAIAAANPNVGPGRRLDMETLIAEAHTAMEAGPEALAKFMTEVLCMESANLDPAIDPQAWAECVGDVDMGALRNRVAACLDVSPDGKHATLAAAAVDRDGMVRVEAVRQWDSTRLVRRSLPAAVAKIRPRVFGWFPNGPAAAITTALSAPKQRTSRAWPPAGVEVREIRTEVPAVCMGLDELVVSNGLVHPDDELINDHVRNSTRLHTANVWVFDRRDSAGPIDATYAVAGAVHLARMLPPPPTARRMILPPD